MNNILTIDVEEFYHRNDIHITQQHKNLLGNRARDNTLHILKLLREYDAKATFFILGTVLETFPDLLEIIHTDGHEIASHGYSHELVYNTTEEEFFNDLKKSKELLGSTGYPIIGYRAPSWSITENSLWGLKILKELGFKYDSSIFPFKTFLYGINNLDPAIIPEGLIEIQPPTFICMPFSGGFYFRVLPYIIIKHIITYFNNTSKPVMIYFHSWEIDDSIPKLDIMPHKKIIPYAGLNSARPKFIRLLKDFKFNSICETSGLV